MKREIIKLRFGIGDGYTYTLEEVWRVFRVTRERIRRVEARAIEKLKHPARAAGLAGFGEESAEGQSGIEQVHARRCTIRPARQASSGGT